MFCPVCRHVDLYCTELYCATARDPHKLFMVPALRKAILEAKLPRRKLEDYPRELVGRRVSLQWEAGGSIEAFVAGNDERTGALCSLLSRSAFVILRITSAGISRALLVGQVGGGNIDGIMRNSNHLPKIPPRVQPQSTGNTQTRATDTTSIPTRCFLYI